VGGVNKATFGGSINVVIPGGKCPTADQLGDALSKAYLSTPKGAAGVSVGPAKATVKIGDTEAATLTVQGLAGTVLSKPGPQGVSSPTVVATAGSVVTQSVLMQINPYNLAGRKMSLQGSDCKLTPEAKGTQVRFACPKLQVQQKFVLDAGSGDLQIKGTLSALGRLADAKLVPASDVPSP